MKILQTAEALMREHGLFGQLEEPTISVVIPAYREAGIADTLKSIEEQGYRKLDVHVVVNGGDEETYRAARAFADDSELDIDVYMLREKGVGRARNYGARRARGDVVLWMDADAKPGDRLFEGVAKSYRAGYAGGKVRLNPEGEDYGLYRWTNLWNTVLTPLRNLGLNMPATGSGQGMYATRDVFRTADSRHSGLFPEDMQTSEDAVAAKRIEGFGPVAFNKKAGVKSSTRRVKGRPVQAWLELARGYLGDPTGDYPVIREAA